MTNETAPHENGVVDPAAIAAIAAENTSHEQPAAAPEGAATAAAEPEVPAEPKPPSFDDLGLHPDIKLALDDMGYFAPTGVQTAVFKPVSEGKDLLVQSKTGTGKTTAFGLPTLNKLIPTHRAPQALILAPTRELALQVARELTSIGKHRGIVVEAIYGGAPIGKQIQALRDGVHVIVGTPGRVLDHIGRRTLDCRTITTFILDECDEMLSMGFLEDIERVVSNLPEKRQTLLFSATMPDEVQRYARRHMRAPEQISLSRDSISVSDIHHAYYIVSGIARSRDLLKVIFAEEPESAIIFCNMRDETTMVAKFLQKQGLDAEPLSSDLSQADRERVMGRMKKKNLRFLCATDVAARGIDISDLSHVINYSVPESPEVYVHRTGRTGRAGKKGTALSLVGPRELGNFRYVRLQFGIKPEERVLPKDGIFEGKLKVPLPPVGTPQPPDPVQILIRGIAGTPSDLERQIFEKLYASSNGKRVLAMLVAEKLDKLSTRTKPKRERVERDHEPTGDGAPAEGGEQRADGERGERGGFDRDRPRRFDRDGERPRRFDRDGERRFDRDGERPRRFDRDGERGERRFDRDRGEGERPRRDGDGERGERRFDRDRGDRGERGEQREGSDRGERRERDGGDRGERRERFRDRDRGRDRFDRDRERPRDTVADSAPPAEASGAHAVPADVSGAHAVPAELPVGDTSGAHAVPATAQDVTVDERPVTPRSDEGERPRRDRDRNRGERHRDRDHGEARADGERGERGDHDRDRHRHDRHRDRDRDRREERTADKPAQEQLELGAPSEVTEATEVGTEAPPAVVEEVRTARAP
ncbi:MAG: DEAD/DEAH box helicase, partial [Deltaproteobacteria bacterium]|nr:DEAD/DEAH box helicase [Deltaproteobacteria bacterium]